METFEENPRSGPKSARRPKSTTPSRAGARSSVRRRGCRYFLHQGGDTDNENNRAINPRDLSMTVSRTRSVACLELNTRQLLRVVSNSGEGTSWGLSTGAWRAYVSSSQIQRDAAQSEQHADRQLQQCDRCRDRHPDRPQRGRHFEACRLARHPVPLDDDGPTNGCAPLDIFGIGRFFRMQALNYVVPGRTGDLGVTDQSALITCTRKWSRLICRAPCSGNCRPAFVAVAFGAELSHGTAAQHRHDPQGSGRHRRLGFGQLTFLVRRRIQCPGSFPGSRCAAIPQEPVRRVAGRPVERAASLS